MKKPNIAFIGPRGAGKSKISRKAGKKTRRAVFSTDTILCYEAGGLSIPAIVEKEGWASFRQREYETLRKLTAMQEIVIDCGGGILVEASDGEHEGESFSHRKAELLKSSATVIYIKRRLEWLLEKSTDDSSRPDLSATVPYIEILQKRLPFYEEFADYTLDMRNLDLEDAIETLIRKFKL